MERVAFLLEHTGERLGCLLNPESLVVRRLAGVQPRRSAGGWLTGAGLGDAPLLYTGGGSTELRLDLLFDTSIRGSSITTDDVRELTGPLSRLAENAVDEDGYGRPPLARFVWGKSWNIPGVVAAVAERFESFTPGGSPRRSWLRMRFLRVTEPTPPLRESSSSPRDFALALEGLSVPPEQMRVHEVSSGQRLDQIAHQYYGDASFWRFLAVFNGLNDPGHLPPGYPLQIPPLSALEGH
jgi:hypothetical protein